MKLRTPAARVKQGDLVVYLISVKVEQLIADGFYDVERLDPETDEGYQRLLNKARAKRLADYVVDGQANNTSVPHFQDHASDNWEPEGAGSDGVVNRSWSGRRSNMLSWSTCSIW